MTILRKTITTAKKKHFCIWCGEKIKIGEKYLRCIDVSDGDFQSNSFHFECNLACNRDAFVAEEGFFPYTFYRGMTESEAEICFKKGLVGRLKK